MWPNIMGKKTVWCFFFGEGQMKEVDFLVGYRETWVLNIHKTNVRLQSAEAGRNGEVDCVNLLNKSGTTGEPAAQGGLEGGISDGKN